MSFGNFTVPIDNRVESRLVAIANLNPANPDLTYITYCYFPRNASSANLLRYRFEAVLAHTQR
ncbi:hypothetical protein NIES267_01820 [Calothrix parasitica NIES-267]|uniref:Uncharacterized protein n=1 Tax=Calothrix parasitica NIES-267 TaxID=1973488 RepID=A0A1Z4LHL2_9CYAN|nr:hypothetical protein NIES267_01820 [Calothrix parasitica NIES-267]